MPETLMEWAREIPVAGEFDLCVIGGSCTGVFAAVRAARLGLKVALVEQNICLGGMATAAQVNEWHSLEDIAQTKTIIGGLTAEVLFNLRSIGVVKERERQHRGMYYSFNSAELALELDRLAVESGIRLFLNARGAGALRDGNRLLAAIIEDRSGRRAIRARAFIDASGDGTLLRYVGFPAWQNPTLQPVGYQMLVAGLNRMKAATGKAVWPQVAHLAKEFSYPRENATPWVNEYPAPADINNIYGPRLNGVDASDADQYTEAVLESRKHLRSFLNMVRKELGPEVTALALAQGLGVRETWHAQCLHRLTASELLEGAEFPDSIAVGTYPVDVHSPEGTVLRYLDGREEVIDQQGKATWGRWRDASAPSKSFYQIPYRSLVPQGSQNLLVAGRLLDADREAYGGIRVMVNLNQTGEAAGVAAYLALQAGTSVADVDAETLRSTLRRGGSLLPVA